MSYFAGLGVTGFGLLLQASSHIAAGEVPTGPTGTDIAPWLQGGGSAAAVAGLVYVARMVVKGQLVPRAIADNDAELGAAIRAAGEREAMAMRLAEAAQKQTADYRDLASEARLREQKMMTLMGKSEQVLEDVQRRLHKLDPK